MTNSFLSKRRMRWAGVAAFIGCAACCLVPLLAATTLSGGAAAAISGMLRPGSELLVGGVVFVGAIAVMAVRHRHKGKSSCGPSCKADGGCCERGSAQRTA